MSSNPGSQQFPFPFKKMGSMDPLSNDLGPQQLFLPNKTIAYMGPLYNNQGSHQLSVPNKYIQMESLSNTQGSQHLTIPNKRTTQMEPSPKGQPESFESVRSKLRESLATSLAMVPQQQNKLRTLGENSQTVGANTLGQANEDSQPAVSSSTTADVASCQVPDIPLESLPLESYNSAKKHNDNQSSSQENTEVATKPWKYDGQVFQVEHLSPEEASFTNNFLIDDELLQGNGLCWVSDLDVEIAEEKESHSAKRPKLVHEEGGGDEGESAVQSPQTLAIKIEAELFKLFGGVNKKYKEKGRSLLFNLKDRNNPELRERVMSGEISPKRLCSMTAEDLASKELSEWRIAKAEELAQMIVLPDSVVDIRRLVKKTHKGEFQVEVEQDDSVSVEVTVGESLLSQIRPRSNETEPQLLSTPGETETSEVTVSHEQSNLEGQSLPNNLTTLPHDGTDFMQGFMVDELKDAEFLPPIVSLDEFMESLDSEPPFENLPVDVEQTTPVSDEKKSSDVGSKLDASDISPVGPADTTVGKPFKMGVKYTRTGSKMKSSDIRIESETSPPGGASKGEQVWEGLLQLNISAMVTVVGFFKSGEKTSTKEWPNILEIKGRVRLDPFEKFLQELPKSRSRAIMVLP